MTRVVLIVLSAALLWSAPWAAANPVAGEFRGSMRDSKGRPIPVILTVDGKAAPGGTAGRIVFGEPWACGFTIELSGEVTYAFKGVGVGPCRSFTRGLVRLHPGDEGRLAAELAGGDGGIAQKVMLAPASAAPAGPVAGDFWGVLETTNRPVPVILTGDGKAGLGATAGRIAFKEPWMCGFALEFSGESTYSFKGPGAGPCARLTYGFVRVRPGDGGRLIAELAGGDGKVSDKLMLSTAPAR